MADKNHLPEGWEAKAIYNAAVGKGTIPLMSTMSETQWLELITRFLNDDISTGEKDLDDYIVVFKGLQDTGEMTKTILDKQESDSILDKIEGAAYNLLPWILSGFKGSMKDALAGTNANLAELTKGYDFPELSAYMQRLVDAKMIDAEGAMEMDNLFSEQPVIKKILPYALPIASIMQLVQAIMGTAGGDYGKHLMSTFTPSAPDVANMLRLGFMSPGDSDNVRDKLKENGLNEADQNLLFKASLTLLDVESLRVLFLRKEIDSNTLFARMRQLGHTDDRTADIVKTWDVIPGIQDLLYMAAKEAFEPDIVNYYGYDDEFPGEQSAAMEANGLSEYWQKRNWYAHWTPPSIGQGYEMLHRRVINETELDDLFRTQEVPPWWRDKLRDISYNPLTRVDVRRMYGVGVLGEQEVYEAYLDIGYNDLNARRMTEFTIKYEQDEDRELTRTQIETYYKNSMLTRDVALELLTGIGYSADRADYFLVYQDYEQEQDYIEDVISNTGEMYSSGLIDYDTAQSRMYELNLPTKRVSSLFDKWNIKIYKARKLPSKTDLDKFYKAGLIDILRYSEELLLLGYSEKYVALYAALTESQGRT